MDPQGGSAVARGYGVNHQLREELMLILKFELRFSISTLCYNTTHNFMPTKVLL